MKTQLIKVLFFLLLIVFFSENLYSQPDRELLVYIKSDFIDFPNEFDQALSIEDTIITSTHLFNLLDSFDVEQISRTFPEFSEIDTMETGDNGVVFSVAHFSKIYTLLLPTSGKADSLLLLLLDLPEEIVFVQKNQLGTELASIDDPDYDLQWYLRNNGEYGTPGADIKIEPVWNSTIIGTSKPIAILDDGVKINHIDLNSGTHVTGDDDWICSGHGTQVAGIIGALHNNYYIRGINKTTPIISYGIYNRPIHCGGFNTTRIADKVRAASDACYVLNSSYVLKDASGNYIWPPVVRLAYQYSVMKGRVNVAAVGNTGNTFAWAPSSFSGTISVGAQQITMMDILHTLVYRHI